MQIRRKTIRKVWKGGNCLRKKVSNASASRRGVRSDAVVCEMKIEKHERTFKKDARITMKPRFTLLELLIAIAMIAVLVSLLLPALGKARATGRSVRCLSNQKMLSLAQTSYSVDNHEWLLPAALVASSGNNAQLHEFWGGMLAGYRSDGSIASPYGSFMKKSEAAKEIAGVKQFYFTGALTCPEQSLEFAYGAFRYSHFGRGVCGGANTSGSNSSGGHAYMFGKTNVLTRPSEAVFTLDHPLKTTFYDRLIVSMVEHNSLGMMTGFHHTQRCNVSFFDGHCESVSRGVMEHRGIHYHSAAANYGFFLRGFDTKKTVHYW